MKYLLLLLSVTFLHAAEADEEEEVDLSPHVKTTTHTIQLPSGPLSYTAHVGICPIVAGEEEIVAELFFLSFTKDGGENRPVTFFFPGGPGGAGTVGTILTFGPRRLISADEGRTILPPYKMIDNAETLLEFTDLVFVDPPDCGFSRTTENANLRYFYSVDGDIQTLGTFVHTYIDFFQRWNSPVYLAGGSYGTLRCCGLAENLLQYGLLVQGLLLHGCAFEFSTLFSLQDKGMPDCLMIPTFAATAWYHGRLWPEKTLAEVIDYARRFTFDEYAPVMLQPSRLSAAARNYFDQRLAQLIGLTPETVKRYNGRINERIYTSEFFGSERKVLGGLDTRYSGDVATINPNHSPDPSYRNSQGAVSAFKSYLQKELNIQYTSLIYRANTNLISYWDFGTTDSLGEPNLLWRLRHVMVINPLMKVFVGSGYYDCRTPFAATEYCFDHLDLPPSYFNNIQFEYYEGGHGFLFDYPCLKKWKQDLTKFYGH